MRGEIVSVGTELLLGHITDTNASWLAQELSKLGIDCYYVSQLGDNLGRLTDHLRLAWSRSDLIVMSGGVGPTEDDLTREAIAVGQVERLRDGVDRDLAIERRLAELREEHKDLDDSIRALEERFSPDMLQIARLKRKKLLLKDEIGRLEDQLMPDIIA